MTRAITQAEEIASPVSDISETTFEGVQFQNSPRNLLSGATPSAHAF